MAASVMMAAQSPDHFKSPFGWRRPTMPMQAVNLNIEDEKDVSMHEDSEDREMEEGAEEKDNFLDAEEKEIFSDAEETFHKTDLDASRHNHVPPPHDTKEDEAEEIEKLTYRHDPEKEDEELKEPLNRPHAIDIHADSDSPVQENNKLGNKRRNLQKSEPPSQNYTWMMFFVFLVLDTVLIGFFVIVYAHIGHHSMNRSPVAYKSKTSLSLAGLDVDDRFSTLPLEDSAFCLPCLEVYKNRLEVRKNAFGIAVKEDETELAGRLCCAEPHDDLKTFVSDMYLDVQYPRDRAEGRALPSSEKTNDNGDHKPITPVVSLVIDWARINEAKKVNDAYQLALENNMSEESLLNSSLPIKLQNGNVRVLQSGVFYLFSRLPIEFFEDEPHFKQFVYQCGQDGGPRLLLENMVHACETSHETCCEYSFVGGLFRLDEGDELCLRVSSSAMVNQDRQMEIGIQRL